jgi:hypothetical protein
MNNQPTAPGEAARNVNRRRFIAGTSAKLGLTLLTPKLAFGVEANTAINLGLIGCGGRGKWIANLFRKQGGYKLVAVADYFQNRLDSVGEEFQVGADRRFTGLSGYKRLLEQPLDAVVIQSPPYFHPEQAAAAVAAGKHVYLAQPVAESWKLCAPLNPFLGVWKHRAANEQLQPTVWPDTAAQWLSGESYARRFWRTMRTQPAIISASRHAGIAAQDDLMRAKLDRENLFALLWSNES